MKITRNQLSNIIKGELSENTHKSSRDFINEADIPDFIKKHGTELGIALILSMIATQDGREKLSSILVAIPDFIKKYICGLPEGWLSGNGDSESGRGARGIIGKGYGMLCRGGVTTGFWYLYILAWAIRMLSDDQAKVIISRKPSVADFKKRSGKSGEKSQEEPEVSPLSSAPEAAGAESEEEVIDLGDITSRPAATIGFRESLARETERRIIKKSKWRI